MRYSIVIFGKGVNMAKRLVFVLALVLWLGAFPAWASGIPADGLMTFDILENGQKTGTRHLRFNRSDGKLTVQVSGPGDFTATEVWIKDYPLTLKTSFGVEATWDRERVEILSRRGLREDAASVHPASYWNRATITQASGIVDLKDGQVLPFVVHGSARPHHHKITAGSGVTDLEYDPSTGELVRVSIAAEGVQTEYRRTDAPGE